MYVYMVLLAVNAVYNLYMYICIYEVYVNHKSHISLL